jgi:hypothetical protein
MLYMEIAFHCKNSTEHEHCAQDAEILVLKLAMHTVTTIIEILGMSQSNNILTSNATKRDGETRNKT